MTVQELIDVLQDVENKDLQIYVFDDSGYIKDADIAHVREVDDSLTDRVDLNI